MRPPEWADFYSGLSTKLCARRHVIWTGIPFIPWHYTFKRKPLAFLMISACALVYGAGTTNGDNFGDKTLAVYAVDLIERFVHT